MNLEKLFNPEVFVFLIPIAFFVAYYWYKISKTNSDNELKRDMLERGMSAEEIERVLKAGTNKDDKDE